MPLEMIDPNDGEIQCVGQGFGKAEADMQSPGKARASGYRDGVEILPRDSGLLECLHCYEFDRLDVPARRKLRHYSSKLSMKLMLGGHNIGKNSGLTGNDGCSSFIAGGFNSQKMTTGGSHETFRVGREPSCGPRSPCSSSKKSEQLTGSFTWRFPAGGAGQ